jgi:hypothetical protein
MDRNPLKYEKLLNYLQKSLRSQLESQTSEIDKKFKDQVVSVLTKQKENPQMKNSDNFKVLRDKIREIITEYQEYQS